MTQDETKLKQCVANLQICLQIWRGLVTLDVSSFVKDDIEMIEFKVTDDGEGMRPKKCKSIRRIHSG